MAETDPQRDPIVDEEAEAAAAEAAKIGGPAPDDPVDDPAQRPLVEGGEGEAEGFELAEEQLIDHASHGDQHSDRLIGRDALGFDSPEEDPGVYGEADEEHKPG